MLRMKTLASPTPPLFASRDRTSTSVELCRGTIFRKGGFGVARFTTPMAVRRQGIWKPIACATLLVSQACAARPPVQESRPPAPPAMRVLQDAARAPAVAVRPTPETAVFRPLFERTLGRAGFRVLSAPEANCLTVNLSGNGSTTSGANEQGSKVEQTFIMDIAVFVDGRLQSEHHSEVGYMLFRERESESETFAQFTRRVADAQQSAFAFLAVDLTNKLIASLPP